MAGLDTTGAAAPLDVARRAGLRERSAMIPAWFRATLAGLLVAAGTVAYAADAPPEVHLAIENGRFVPDEVRVPANTPFLLVVVNKGAEPDEFESEALRIEKAILPGKTLRLKIRGLGPGTYGFAAERAETAKGRIVVE